MCDRAFPGTPGSCDWGGHGEMTSSPRHVTHSWRDTLCSYTPLLSRRSFKEYLFSLAPAAMWVRPNASLYNDEWCLTPSGFCSKLQINIHPQRPRGGIYTLICSQCSHIAAKWRLNTGRTCARLFEMFIVMGSHLHSGPLGSFRHTSHCWKLLLCYVINYTEQHLWLD